MAEVERGITKLDAVNEMLRAVDLLPVSALAPGTATEEGEAEEVLDNVLQLKLAQGQCNNIEPGQAFTAALDTGSYFIDFASTVLDIKCIAPARYAGNIRVRTGRAYNIAEATANFGSAVVIYCDVVRELAWSVLDAAVKMDVLAEAMLRYRRRRMPNAAVDQMLQQERAETAIGTRGNLDPAIDAHRRKAPAIVGSQPQERA